MNSALLQKIPESPAGAQMRWYLGCLLSAGEGASPEDRARYTLQLRKRLYGDSKPGDERARWRGISARLGEVTCLTANCAGDFAIRAFVATAKGHKSWLAFEVEAEPPHLIAKTDWQRQGDFKLEVRKATEADGPVLAEIERRCPIVLGDTSIYFDRGEDYFAFTRLMEEATVGIAFVDDKRAAVSCGALHEVRIGGVIHPIVTVAHLRVMPEHQRKGLWARSIAHSINTGKMQTARMRISRSITWECSTGSLTLQTNGCHRAPYSARVQQFGRSAQRTSCNTRRRRARHRNSQSHARARGDVCTIHNRIVSGALEACSDAVHVAKSMDD